MPVVDTSPQIPLAVVASTSTAITKNVAATGSSVVAGIFIYSINIGQHNYNV